MSVADSSFIKEGYLTLVFCILGPLLGFVFSYFYYKDTAEIILDPNKLAESGKAALIINEDINSKQAAKIWEVYNLIYDGAHAFLFSEYRYISIFVAIFSVIILIVLGAASGGKGSTGTTGDHWVDAIFTVIAFIVGCGTSVLAGYIGMKIGVFANARTAIQCQASLAEGFVTAFKAAVVMGFVLCAMGVLNLYLLIMLFRLYYSNAMDMDDIKTDETQRLFEAIAGYGLGGSSIALFGRVGGGIYTKAADVGADLVGKVEAGIPEDDPRNPAVIADNVGDNVGDIAGMGSDLFGSFAESSCAALVIASQARFAHGAHDYTSQLYSHWGWVSFPLIISASGIFVCFATSFVATHMSPPRKLSDIEPTLKRQLLVSTGLMTIVLLALVFIFLPSETLLAVHRGHVDGNVIHNWHMFFCAASGLWSGLIIGYLTEYYTSNQYTPVQDLSKACQTGAATNIILGLALGMKSDIIPAITLAVAAYLSHTLAGFYGVALAALGILSTMSIGLTIDAFGPISDNAGGIAEMCELGEGTRERTDALDAAGNTTAAIGKGFAIGSAAFVSLALFSGYVTILQNRLAGTDNDFNHIDMLDAFPFSGLLVGAMLPYWFSAMTMAAVGRAAFEMVNEVRRQFRNDAGILSGESKPDYKGCIDISTTASLKEMVGPGALVMITPLVVGFFLGVKALAGVLIGALVSGVQMAISSSNTGGAWDNAKKYIEQGKLGQDQGKGSDAHKAAVVGDTVGDPLKDTSGPSLNILIKLMAVESLVFARAFAKCPDGIIPWAIDKIGS